MKANSRRVELVLDHTRIEEKQKITYGINVSVILAGDGLLDCSKGRTSSLFESLNSGSSLIGVRWHFSLLRRNI